MDSKDNIFTLNNLRFYPYTPNKNQIINNDIPFSTIKYSTNYTKKHLSKRNIFKNVYKTYNRNKNNIYNNNKTDYYSLVTNPNNIRNKIINKSLNKRSQKNITNGKGLLLSLIKSPKKNYINKNNFIFIHKKDEITNLHKNLMEQNKLSVILKQEKEIKKILFNEDKKNLENEKRKINLLNKKSMFLFEKEYDKIPKNKIKEKYLILKEINSIGKKLSFANLRNIDDIMNDIDINNKLFSKRVKEKDSLLAINHISTLPSLGKDQKLVSDLWKKDMIKYCKLTLDEKNNEYDQLVKDLLHVYS